MTSAKSIATTPSPPAYRFVGGAIAGLIFLSWGGALALSLLRLDPRSAWSLLAIPVLAFLDIGLFIVAHDAMHGLIFPRHPKLNALAGIAGLRAFALFDYRKMLAAHRRHHAAPASVEDPDFHAVHERANEFDKNAKRERTLLFWFGRFIGRYMSAAQLCWLAAVAIAMNQVLGISALSIFAFWILPLWLGSFQLFYFGTYLPHRERENGYADSHCARSNEYPEWLSMLTCYHFGYHWEHHAYPFVPWWLLPTTRRLQTKGSESFPSKALRNSTQIFL